MATLSLYNGDPLSIDLVLPEAREVLDLLIDAVVVLLANDIEESHRLSSSQDSIFQDAQTTAECVGHSPAVSGMDDENDMGRSSLHNGYELIENSDQSQSPLSSDDTSLDDVLFDLLAVPAIEGDDSLDSEEGQSLSSDEQVFEFVIPWVAEQGEEEAVGEPGEQELQDVDVLEILMLFFADPEELLQNPRQQGGGDHSPTNNGGLD